MHILQIHYSTKLFFHMLTSEYLGLAFNFLSRTDVAAQ